MEEKSVFFFVKRNELLYENVNKILYHQTHNLLKVLLMILRHLIDNHEIKRIIISKDA